MPHSIACLSSLSSTNHDISAFIEALGFRNATLYSSSTNVTFQLSFTPPSGQIEVIKFLVEKCKVNINPYDR